MPDFFTAPSLHGLRLGFLDLGPASELLEGVLGLAPIAVAPPPAPGRPPRRHYALGGLRIEARVQPSEPAASGLARARPAGADALQWRHADLARQRRRLQQLDVRTLEGADFGCAPCLRLEALDTGACAIELREPAQVRPASGGPGPRLAAIDLAARAPERVAAHWAALLGVPLGRDAGGAPLLHASPVPVRFVPAASACATGVAALAFAADDAHLLARRAIAHGLAVDDAASWSASGLRVRAHGR